MTVTRRFLFLSVFFTFLTIPVLAQNSTAPTQTREGGLVNTTFTIPSAKITVTLPNDIAAGDTISGTVVTEPAGKNDAEKQRNSDTLSGYVIEVGNQKASLSGGIIIRIKIQTKDVIKLALADKTVASAPVPLQPANTSWTGTPRAFTLPSLGQEGRPIQIQGPFDGDSSNTKVSIGGNSAKVLAESPRQVVVANPSTTAGPTTIEVKENNTTTKGTFRNLKIDLTAPKTSLKKGESTELHVEVSGLEGLHQPIPLQLTNQSPNTVNLGGGNTQTIVIQPSQVSTGGTFVKTVPVTGIRSGSFVITSDIPTGLYVPPAPAPGATRPPPSTTPPPTAPPSTKPAPPGPSPAPTFATTLPAPSQNTKFYDSFCKEEIDCCKKARAENADGSLRFVTPPWGNGFQLQGNKLIMVMDGKRYEWLFTQDGEPFDIEWMFCHLNTDQIISQLTSVMVQRVMGGDINETGSTVIVSLFGPYVDEKTRRPSYGFQFQAQKSGTNVKEYGVSFSMDAATCTWSFQLFAEDHTGSYSTGPPGSPLGIYQSLFLNDDLNGSHAYLQGQWWATMYRLAGEMQQWSAWLSDHPDMAQVAQLSQDFGVWRNKVQNALNDLRGSASPADQQLFNQMDSLLSIQNPTPQQMVQIFWKFNNLWMRYRQGVN